MFKKSAYAVLTLVFCVFCALFANGLREEKLNNERAAQSARAWEAKPICGGKDPAQTALESGGTCRPF